MNKPEQQQINGVESLNAPLLTSNQAENSRQEDHDAQHRSSDPIVVSSADNIKNRRKESTNPDLLPQGVPEHISDDEHDHEHDPPLRSPSWIAEFSNSQVEKYENLDFAKEGDGNLIDYLNSGNTETIVFPSVLEWGKKSELTKNFLHDLMSGLTIAAVVCAECLAVAIMGGLPPHYGLYLCTIPLCLYALLGTSKHIAAGPVSVVGIVLGSILIGVPTEEKVQAAMYMSFVVGIMLLILGGFKMGFIEYILSTPALKGFIAGVVFRIILEQAQNVFAVKCQAHTSYGVIYELFSRANEWNIGSLITGIIVMVFLGALLALKKVKKSNHMIFFMGPLMTSVLGTLIIGVSGLHETYHIKVVKDIEADIPSGLLFSNPFSNFFSNTEKYLLPGMVLGLIGFVETVAISKEVASQKGYTIDASKEFLSYGIVNVISSFLGCFPFYGSLSRTPISVMAGTRSQLSGFITGLIVTLVCFVGIPVINLVPLTVVGATIIFSVARSIRLLKLVFLLRYYPFPDGFIMALAMISTIVIDPEIGAGITVFCSLLVILKKGTTPWLEFQNYKKEPIVATEEPLILGANTKNYSVMDNSMRMTNSMLNSARLTNPNTKYKFFNKANHEKQLDNQFNTLKVKDMRRYQDFCLCLDVACPEKYHIVILSLGRDFYYLNCHSLKKNLEPLKALAPNSAKAEEFAVKIKAKNLPSKTVNAIVIDCHKVKTIDFTACIALLETIEEFEEVGITVALSELDAQLLKSMRATGLRNNVAAYSNRDTIEIVEKMMDKIIFKERQAKIKGKLPRLDHSKLLNGVGDDTIDGLSVLMQQSGIVDEPNVKEKPIQKNSLMDDM